MSNERKWRPIQVADRAAEARRRIAMLPTWAVWWEEQVGVMDTSYMNGAPGTAGLLMETMVLIEGHEHHGGRAYGHHHST